MKFFLISGLYAISNELQRRSFIAVNAFYYTSKSAPPADRALSSDFSREHGRHLGRQQGNRSLVYGRYRYTQRSLV